MINQKYIFRKKNIQHNHLTHKRMKPKVWAGMNVYYKKLKVIFPDSLLKFYVSIYHDFEQLQKQIF